MASEQKSNPYIDDNLSKAQQQFSPQKNKEFEAKHQQKNQAEEEEKKANKPKKQKSTPIQIVIRDSNGWRYYNQDTKSGKLHIISNNTQCTDADITFSEDGKYFAVILIDCIQIYKSSKCKLIATLNHTRVRNVYFSPFNNYFISYHHRTKEDQDGNVWIWKKIKKKFTVIYKFFASEFNKNAVPFPFSSDECIGAQIIKNNILIHSFNQSKNTIHRQIEIPKVASVVIAPCDETKQSPNSSYLFAVFAKATSYKAATVTIYEYTHVVGDANDAKDANAYFRQISQRQFFVIDDCKLLWDPSPNTYHHNLLVVVSSQTDTSGASYYGTQDLFLMSSESDKSIKIDVKVALQDVAWHPNGNEFVLIDDRPLKISIFDTKGNCVHCIGKYARNVIRFSLCGNFLWLGGFGNLQGKEMTFYDYKNIRKADESDEYLKGYNKDGCSRYFEWCPDASLYITARLHPFMTVDNGFCVYKYNACKLYEEKIEKLYQVAYRPSRKDVYPERTVSKKALSQSQPVPSGQQIDLIEEEIKKTRYVPPHLRNKADKKAKKYRF